MKLPRLYLGNLPYQVTPERLIEIFTEYGFTTSHPHIVKDRETGQPKGFGFIQISSQAEADRAVAEMDGGLFDGRTLRVSMAIERPESTQNRTRQ